MASFDLRKEVEELRKRGASLGLNQDDIDYAILKSLEEAPSSNSNGMQGKTNFQFCKFIFVFLATMLCVLFILMGVVFVASERDKQFSLMVGRTFADFTYPMVRFVRLATLPIHSLFDISYMYSWECIVNNPSYEQGGPECDICINAKRVPIKSSRLLPQADFKEKFFDPGFSVIIRNVSGYGDMNHTYEELISVYKSYKTNIDQDSCEFYINGDNKTVENLGQLLSTWQHYQPNGHIVGWKLCYGKGFREVRKLYKRPYFVHSEGSLEKMIYLLQPSGTHPEALELPNASFDNVWYAQVDGSTEVVLTPVPDCYQQCKIHTVNLIKGDVLFFTQQIWRATFRNKKSNPAITFVSSFA